MRFPSTSPGQISGGDNTGSTAADQAADEEEEEQRQTSSPSPEPPDTDPAPDPTPDDIQRTNPGPTAPPDPEPPDTDPAPDPTPDDIQRTDPGPTGSPDTDTGAGSNRQNGGSDQQSDPRGSQDQSTGSGGSNTVRDGIDRALDQTTGDATDSPVGNAVGGVADYLFGTDSRDRGVVGPARDRLDRAASRFDRRVADPLREDRSGRQQAVAPGVGGLGAAANSEFVRDSAAQTAELLNPARAGSDLLGLGAAGAQFGDFLADEEGALGETAAAAGDAAAAAPGAAVDAGQFVAENPRDAAVTGTALFASLGAGAAAGAATRGAARGAGRFASRLDNPVDADRVVADGSGTFDEFVRDTRAQTGRFRQRGDRSSSEERISGDDIDPRDDRTSEIARQQFEQSRFEVEQRFGEEIRDRVPERPTRDGPGEINDIGDGIAGQGDPGTFGVPGETLGERTRRLSRQAERAENLPDADLRDVTAMPARATAGGPGAATTGAGAAGLGSIAETTDPTNIAPTGFGPAGTAVDPANDPTSIASTAVTGTQSLAPANDPTGIDPAGIDGFGQQRLGGGTLPGDASGGESDTGTLDATNDPTNVAPPASDTRPGTDQPPATDTPPATGTDQPPASDTGQPPVTDTPPATDTDQPPVTDTPVPPVVDTPPVTDTPTPPTNRPPSRPPTGTPPRAALRRRLRRRPEPDEERERFGLAFDDDDDDEPAPRRGVAAPLAVGFGAETFTAFATGAFGERELARSADAPSLVGELPTETLAEPSDTEAASLAAVSEQFFGEFGGGG